MRVFFRCWLLIVLLALTSSASAQESYAWEAGGLTLTYPAGWNAPLSSEQNGQPVLEMAQVLVDTPLESRPPGIPIITLTLVPNGFPDDGDLLPILSAALATVNIDTLDAPGERVFLGDTALQLTGTSADGQLFGIGRAAPVGINDVLVITGRAAQAQQNDFLAIFDGVANSIRLPDDQTAETTEVVEELPSYGVLWQTQRTQADAEEAFLNLIGLAYTPANHLYTYERDLGVVQLDAATGEVLSIFPNANITEPSDLAAARDGTVYVADTACACIFTLDPEGIWLDRHVEGEEEIPFDPATSPGLLTGFGEGAPAHLTVGLDGALYATQITSTSTVSIMVFDNGALINEIRLEDDLFEQPLLAGNPSGQIYALTQFGELIDLTDVTQVNALGSIANQLNDLTIAPDGNLVIATQDQGILILTPDGEFVNQPGSLVPNFPLPGEMVEPKGVAVDVEGTLYFADSDGTFGSITAMSTSIAPNRLGSMTLTPGVGVQGVLNAQSPQQSWLYNGTSGERVTITAVDRTGTGELDLALRLMNPLGLEAAFNDDHTSQALSNFTDAQIADFPLTADGQYIIIAERVNGEGPYNLGLSLTGRLEFDAGGVARVTGQLDIAFPETLWELNGTAGQVLTITLEATSGDLDPILRLIGPDGSVVAENDDAEDSALGTSAQLPSLILPEDGVYHLQATRFDGSGGYTLTVVSTS